MLHPRRPAVIGVTTAAVLVTGLGAAQPALGAPAVFTVTSTADAADAAAGDGTCAAADGSCTLRAAIEEANQHAGPDTVAFALPGTGPQTIQLESVLPVLADDGTTIDGYTQPGARPNTSATAFDAEIRVQVRGRGSSAFDALNVRGAENTIRGLAIFDTARAIMVIGDQAVGTRIVGNVLGSDATGTFVGEGPGFGIGVRVQDGARDTTLGGRARADRNVVVGNPGTGIYVEGTGTTGTVIQGNLVGLRPDGSAGAGNYYGIDLNRGVQGTVIGGTAPGEANVISGNQQQGVEISHEPETSGNVVVGNLIGTDVSGRTTSEELGNGAYGVVLQDRVRDNEVRGNTIVGASDALVFLQGDDVAGNHVHDNALGVIGGEPVGDTDKGVVVASGTGPNTIGPGNVIRGMRTDGVAVSGDVDSFGIRITANQISDNGGLGINLPPLLAAGADAAYTQAPAFTTAQSTAAAGTACAGCTVEVFASDAGPDGSPAGPGQGRLLLGTAVADADGRWVTRLPGTPAPFVTATATRADGTTSEFSERTSLRPTARRVRFG